MADIEAMQCPDCGHQNPLSATRCSQCRAFLIKSEAPSATPETSPTGNETRIPCRRCQTLNARFASNCRGCGVALAQGQVRPQPSVANRSTSIGSNSVFSYPLLRKCFVAGCLANIILTFVPSVKVVHRDFIFGNTTSEELLSNFDLIQMGFQTGQNGLAFLAIIIFGSWIALSAMAVVNPIRWVFIAGGAIAGFTILVTLFSPTSGSVEIVTLTLVLGYGADALMLSGFLANPDEVS